VSYTSKNVNGVWVKDRWIEGITFGTLGTLGTHFSLLSTHIRKELETQSQVSQVSQEFVGEVVTGVGISDTNSIIVPEHRDCITKMSMKGIIMEYLSNHKHSKISDIHMELNLDFDQLCDAIDSLKAQGEIIEKPAGTVMRLD